MSVASPALVLVLGLAPGSYLSVAGDPTCECGAISEVVAPSSVLRFYTLDDTMPVVIWRVERGYEAQKVRPKFRGILAWA